MPSPLQGLRDRVARSETTAPIVISVAVGLLAGSGAIVLRKAIELARLVFQERPQELLPPMDLPSWMASWHMVLAPAVGLVLVRFPPRRCPDSRGSGVPEVQMSVRMGGGRIPWNVAVYKTLATALTIGSGGTLGREGPTVQIGSTLGSTVGQLLGLSSDQLRLLVACGAAGAIGATFDAPIAGVMFALEVVLASFAARAFGLVVISSVTATALARAFLGEDPAFRLVETFNLVSEAEFGLYLMLGVLSGGMALVYVKTISGVAEAFYRWKASDWGKAVVAGLGVGVLGVVSGGQVFDVGNEGVELALNASLALWFMLLLALVKTLTAALALAGGGSGGKFAPALFIGAMVGGAFGGVVNALFPSWTAPAGAYALVGMGALFGAAAHAPITAILILFEMTDTYTIILPLMFCVVVAYLVAAKLSPDSMYSIELRRRGGMSEVGGGWSVLDLALVEDMMDQRVETVPPDLTLEELENLARHKRTRSWPVSADGKRLLGIVTDTDLEHALIHRAGEVSKVEDIMTRSVIVCSPGETVRAAFRRFTERDVQLIPVVEGGADGRIVGILRRHDMLWAYREMSQEHEALLEQVSGRIPMRKEETLQVEYLVPSDDRRVAFRRVREIQVPPHTLVVLVRRAGRSLVPRGETRVEAGDVLVLLTTREYEEEVSLWLKEGSSGSV